MTKIEELKSKISKMEKGLDNQNIAAAQKEILKKAIANAKTQLDELEGTSKKQPSDKFEVGTPVSFLLNNNWVSGEVVERQEGKQVSLYKDDNYSGSSERLFVPDWEKVLTLSERNTEFKAADQKEEFQFIDEEGKYFTRIAPSGKSSWTTSKELGYVYSKSDSESFLPMVKREYPTKKIEIISFFDSKPKPEKTKDKKIKPGVYLFDGVEYDLNKEIFPEMHPIMMYDPKAPALKGSVLEWFSDKKKITEFIENVLTSKNKSNEFIIKLKQELSPDPNDYDFITEEINSDNFLIFLKLKKVEKFLIKYLGLKSTDYVDVILQLANPNEKLNKIVKSTILKLFINNSQLATSKNKELEEVTDEVYHTVMATPFTGADLADSKFHLHYFNAGSDVYIKEIDFGTGKQDFGYTVLNGDLQNAEYGYVSISELLKLGFELDYYFDPTPAKKFVEELQDDKLVEAMEEVADQNFYEVGDYVKYRSGENPKIDWFGKIDLVKKLDDTFVYRINAYSNTKNIDFHSSKNNEIYQDQLFIDNKNTIELDFLTLQNKYNSKEEDKKGVDGLVKVLESAIDDLDVLILSSEQINKLVTKANAQIFLEYGNNTEIKSIKEVISEDQIDVHFELIREIDGMWDRSESEIVNISFDGEILNEYTFKIPDNFNCEKFIQTLTGELDKRTQNAIYSYSTFLSEHSEEIIGEKVASKTVKKVSPEKQEKLKTEYKKKVAAKTIERKTATAAKKAPTGKVKLTKKLISHGVTQEMVNEVNRTKEGVVIRASSQGAGSNTKHDKQRTAMLPGKRLSADGNIYYEYRKNRTDKNPKNRI